MDRKPNDYRVIIAGGRSFGDYQLLKEHCLAVLQDKLQTHHVIIISGHARGADTLGERFAKEVGLDCELHPAQWREFGRGAGLIRNAEMAKRADALIAFWDGKSRGTGHMISFAKRRGLNVSIVDFTTRNTFHEVHHSASKTSPDNAISTTDNKKTTFRR